MKKQKFNQVGDVIQHPKLGKWCWLVMATSMTGGQTSGGMNGHDDWPDGHQLVLRKMRTGLTQISDINWSEEGEKRFYQSGCFCDKVMLSYIKPTHTFGGK